MARVRNNQGFRKKALDLHIRPYLEQEQTQEREAFLQAREVKNLCKMKRGNLRKQS